MIEKYKMNTQIEMIDTLNGKVYFFTKGDYISIKTGPDKSYKGYVLGERDNVIILTSNKDKRSKHNELFFVQVDWITDIYTA